MLARASVPTISLLRCNLRTQAVWAGREGVFLSFCRRAAPHDDAAAQSPLPAAPGRTKPEVGARTGDAAWSRRQLTELPWESPLDRFAATAAAAFAAGAARAGRLTA